MKHIYYFILACIFLSSFQKIQPRHNTLHQITPVYSLIHGDYDGKMSLSTLHRFGDFGIGTFDKIDGEMIVLDGVIYQVRVDGSVHLPSGQMTTPYASVHFFEQDLKTSLQELANYKQLKSKLTALLPDKKTPYGLKITGTFTALTLRSVAAQTKPYPPLNDVVKTQTIFKHQHIKGTLVGYYCPDFLGQIIVPGYHFHFISNDKTIGGHVLELTLDHATALIDRLDTLSIQAFGEPPLHPTRTANTQAIFQGESTQ